MENYGTAIGFRTYTEARGYVLPASDDTAIEAALVVSSEWLDGRYRSAFRRPNTAKTGGRAQVLEWPRQGFTDADGNAIPGDTVPREIERATYEAATRQLRAPGSLSTDAAIGKAYKRVAIEGAISVEYAGAASITDLQLTIPLIDHILAALVGGKDDGGNSGITASVFRG